MAKRIRSPRIIQMEAVECGAASLAIVLGYFGRFVPLSTLRDECFVSRGGSNAFDLIRAAEKYGLQGEGVRRNAEELRKASYPAILFWKHDHFLVLEGFRHNTVYLNDPAVGRKKISFEEFQRDYSGIALLFSKTEQSQKGGKRVTLWEELTKRLAKMSNPLSLLFLLGFFLLLPGFALPGFLIAFLTFFFPYNLLPATSTFLIAVLATALFTGVLTYFRLYFSTRLNAILSTRLTTQFFWHMLRLPMSFFDLRYPGEVAYRLNLNESAVETITETLISALVDLILVIFFAVLLFAFDVAIASIGVFFGVANLVILYFTVRARANTYARLQQDLVKSVAEQISCLQAIDAIKARAAEGAFFSRWSGYFAKNLDSQQEIGKKDLILSAVPICLQFLSTVSVLTLGSLRIIEGDLSIGGLMGLQLLLTNFFLPINRFVGLSQTFQNLQVDFARLDDVADHPVDPMYAYQAPPASQSKLNGQLEFRNVSFGYSRGQPSLIKNVSFTLSPGKRLGIVGKLGSGKSTIAKMATGLYLPWEGEILYDGKSRSAYPLELLQSSVATVDQQIFLFAGTIRENLTLWNPTVPEEIAVKAAQDACIHEEILRRPQGYEDLLIEGGRNLSGGQRQRMEIARALLYDPALLILDEATSSLDSYLEQEILGKILQRGTSLIMIAHRLSTIRDCDEILVLNHGEIAQRGTHQELKELPGLYQTMLRAEWESER